MTYSKKIVLLSLSGYVPERDDGFLRELLNERVKLFFVLGIDAVKWEDALDWISINEETTEKYAITTTSHDDESLADVIEFAELFDARREDKVQIIER